MGYMRHHAIVVTGSDTGDRLIVARNEALKSIDKNLVSPILLSSINGYASFFIAPDGSKEGWDVSDDGNIGRANLLDYLEANCVEWLDWAEIQYGDDNGDQKMLRSSR